jgi:hypothetical protein
MTTPPKQPDTRLAADDAQLDRTLFSVSPKAYAEFLDRLDAPPQPNERLRRTMPEPAPWDAGELKRVSLFSVAVPAPPETGSFPAPR